MKKIMGNLSITQCYPYSCIYAGERTHLIWQYGDDGDSFALDSRGRLIRAKTNKALKKLLGSNAKKVHWNEGAEIDFDRFWIALRNLRVGRASSSNTCKLLFDGWNFIADLLTTFNMTREKKRLESPLLNRAYRKLFHGINLPSVTPNNKAYSPLWEQAEIQLLRKELGLIRDSLHEKILRK